MTMEPTVEVMQVVDEQEAISQKMSAASTSLEKWENGSS